MWLLRIFVRNEEQAKALEEGQGPWPAKGLYRDIEDARKAGKNEGEFTISERDVLLLDDKAYVLARDHTAPLEVY
jgi:hypothetical protein